MQRPGAKVHRRMRGWALPGLCGTVAALVLVLAAQSLQQLQEDDRLRQLRWRRLQALAGAEAALAQFQTLVGWGPGVDAECRPLGVGAPSTGVRLHQRLGPGDEWRCRVALPTASASAAEGLSAQWQCGCAGVGFASVPESAGEGRAVLHTTTRWNGSPPPTREPWSASALPRVGVQVDACVALARAPGACAPGAAHLRLSVLLQAHPGDGGGSGAQVLPWAQVVGSWSDTTP